MLRLKKYFKKGPELFQYRDRSFNGTEEEYKMALDKSTTVYVGGLASNMSEERVWALFGLCGPIRRVIMGLNRSTLYPCGFAFIEFYSKESTTKACGLTGVRMGGRYIKVDVDYGYVDGRQYGRGVFGGQFREDYLKRRYYG